MRGIKIGVLAALVGFAGFGRADERASLPGAAALTMSGDLSAQMVEGIDRYLMARIAETPSWRASRWQRDTSSPAAYEASIAPNRERLRTILGAVDPRVLDPQIELVATTMVPALIAQTDRYRVLAARWPVFEDVHGEGLLLDPDSKPVARVVLVPDADQTPESLVFAADGRSGASLIGHRLAAAGCQVLIPTLVDRSDTWSGNPVIGKWTNQPHREWIYRQAYELGRHLIGYEVQKVLAAVDCFAREADKRPIGVAGYGEGGLVALASAALDPRLKVALVSGYFAQREEVWREPIYRNVFGLLEEFGDAEVASLILPRTLIVEHSTVAPVLGPPAPRAGRGGAAPGRIETPAVDSVQREYHRLTQLRGPRGSGLGEVFLFGVKGPVAGLGESEAIGTFLAAMGTRDNGGQALADPRGDPDGAARQYRQIHELVEHTQRILRRSEYNRRDFWNQAKPSPEIDWHAACAEYRKKFWDEVIGRLPPPEGPANPRTRRILEDPKWVGHEVVLDVWPGVFAWGYLLVPRDLKEGEKRPVVVCQHGLEGVPMDTVTTDPMAPGYGAYRGFAAHLAERGFIVYAPHNPYRGQDQFRVLQRKANPMGKSLFSVILAQHERTLDWLSSLPFVDPARIGFYGLSYGGKTAMRVPSLLDRYVLSICSADFNEWIKKNATVDDPHSYLFTPEYEMFEFNLGQTFNYAEMAALIAPRPFMVERGHNDGVAPDEWVAYEFAKARRLYAFLGIPERTEIEFFNGPHTINGKGTFAFLHRHLAWPEPTGE